MQNERIKELFLGLTLVVFLILLSVLVISISDNSYSQKQSNIISNSYNVNSPVNSYQVSQNQQAPYPKNRVYITDRNVRYTRPSSSYPKSTYLRYSDHAYQTRKRGILGNDINKYGVYVKNQDYKGGYFTVRYYFEDYYGNVETERITHHINPGKEKQFLLKDVSLYGHDRVSWRYEVVSHSKKPTRKYYNGDYGYYGQEGRSNLHGSPTRTYFYLN